MKLKIGLIVFLFLVNGILSAETLLLYMIVDNPEGGNSQLCDYVESGVMNELFDAGHIIFNATADKEVPMVGLDHYKEPESMQMAKAGGAVYLLEVSVHFNDIAGEQTPSTASFRLIHVSTGNVLQEGEVSLEEKFIREKNIEEGITVMGRSMAGFALSFL